MIWLFERGNTGRQLKGSGKILRFIVHPVAYFATFLTVGAILEYGGGSRSSVKWPLFMFIVAFFLAERIVYRFFSEPKVSELKYRKTIKDLVLEDLHAKKKR